MTIWVWWLILQKKVRVIIDIVKYVELMIEDFPVKISKVSKSPAAKNLLDIGTG